MNNIRNIESNPYIYIQDNIYKYSSIWGILLLQYDSYHIDEEIEILHNYMYNSIITNVSIYLKNTKER